MIREISNGEEVSTLDEGFTGELGRLSFYHPAGTFALTPASRILIEAIINNKDLLSGVGIDWGSGIGCLAILAARINSVKKVYGLDISQKNIDAAKINAEQNNINDKVRFMLADSYNPFSEEEKMEIYGLKGEVNFILANPPSSDWDDGFGFRRIVLEGAKKFLIKGGIVLLNISFQYGINRVESLYKSLGGFSYEGLAASTEPVQFDLHRPDLLDCLKIYAQEEKNGGIEYTFLDDKSDTYMNARTALENYNRSGKIPLTKWQTHMFRYIG